MNSLRRAARPFLVGCAVSVALQGLTGGASASEPAGGTIVAIARAELKGPPLPPEPAPLRAIWPERARAAVKDRDLFEERAAPVADPANGGARDADEDLGVDRLIALLEVRALESTLRLVGHTGAGRTLRGVFQLPSGESVLARAGDRIDSEGVTVRSVELRRDRGAPLSTRRAVASLVRDLTLEVVWLDAADVRPDPSALVAVVRVRSEHVDRTVQTGDIIEDGERAFRVGAITLVPASVEVWFAGPEGGEAMRVIAPSEVRNGYERTPSP